MSGGESVLLSIVHLASAKGDGVKEQSGHLFNPVNPLNLKDVL